MRIELKNSGRKIEISNGYFTNYTQYKPVSRIDRDTFEVEGRRYKRFRFHTGNSYMNTSSGWTISLLDNATVKCSHPNYPNGIDSSEFYAVLPDGEPQRRNSDEEPFENIIERLDRQLFG